MRGAARIPLMLAAAGAAGVHAAGAPGGGGAGRRKVSRGGLCDPASSWLAYTLAKGGGRRVLEANATYVVPAAPAQSGADPSFWFGLEPEPACDLLQPILALNQCSGAGGTNAYCIFHEEFNWHAGDWQTKHHEVQPGDVIRSSLRYNAGNNSVTMRIAADGGPSVTSVRSLGKGILANASAVYTDVWFVVEHPPRKCSMFPQNGGITFTDVSVVLEGGGRPEWSSVQYTESCNCKSAYSAPGTVAFTWDTK